MTVLEEEERVTIPDLTMSATTVMNVIQAGERIKMMMIDAPDTRITAEETIVVIAIAIIEVLTVNGTERVKMTMTSTADVEVETAQSRLVALHPRNNRLLANAQIAYALALGLVPLLLSTRPNPTSLIPVC